MALRKDQVKVIKLMAHAVWYLHFMYREPSQNIADAKRILLESIGEIKEHVHMLDYSKYHYLS